MRNRARTRRWTTLATMLLAGSVLLPEPVMAGSFAVMTYNVKGLPFPLIGDRSDEIRDIAENLQDFHTVATPYVGMASIIGLQEVFDQGYYNTLTNPQIVSYSYITDKDNSGNFDLGDGLTIESDFEIDNFMRTQWEECHGSLDEDGSDCDAPKGFTFAKITLEPDVFFHFYTLHADAGQDDLSRAARRANIEQLIEAINTSSPEGIAVIVVGDTNSLYTRYGTDNFQDLLSETGLQDVWVELRRGGVVPAAGERIDDDCETTPSTANCEEVDKILYRSGSRVVFEPTSYQVLRQMFTGTMTPLSDHDPVAAEFDYTVVEGTTTTTTTVSTSTSTSTSTTTTTLGDRPCGDPIPDTSGFRNDGGGRAVAASDALFVLKSAVGARVCPLCTCDVNDNGSVSATDALIVLKVAVGQNQPIVCPPCDGATTTTTIP